MTVIIDFAVKTNHKIFGRNKVSRMTNAQKCQPQNILMYNNTIADDDTIQLLKYSNNIKIYFPWILNLKIWKMLLFAFCICFILNLMLFCLLFLFPVNY